MKRKIMSLLLALCMIFLLFPATEIRAAAPESRAAAKYYTVEQYDADGNGTMLVPPTETTNWTGSYGTTFITSLLGSANVTMSNGAVTGIKAADGTWLNNNGSSQWYIATDYDKEVYQDSSWFYASDVTVLRFIYVPNGDFGAAGMVADGSWADAYMNVEKGDLIKTLSAYDGNDLGGNRKAAFDAGIATILNINATAEDVAAAKTNMETATDAATAVELKMGDEAVETIDLYEGQKKTLTAELTPLGSTDNLTWTSSDPDVVSVTDGAIKGMSAGTATVTVAAETEGVTDSVEVTVTGLNSVSVSTMTINGSNEIMAESGSLTLRASATPTGIADLDWVWTVEDPSIAEVTTTGYSWMATVKGKAAGTTNIVATLGSKSAKFEVKVTPYNGPYVYFDYDDPDKEDQPLDENDTITLTCLDEGKFVVGNAPGTTTWSGGSANVTSIQGGDDLQYWVFVNSETGKWNPWDVRELNVTANCGGAWSKTFKINCVSSGITELKTYVGNQEVTVDAPYESEGTTSGVPVTVKGKNADGEWIYIPTQALHYSTSDTTYNFRWTGNQFCMNTGGQATLSVFMKDNWSVKQQFVARCNYVPLTGFTIQTPETFTITGDRDYMTGYYYGLEMYSDNLKITYTPSNATYKELTWESLTPDIAFFTAQHNSGIVPLKCGTARFKVTSNDNPSLTQEVVVKFLYKYPLTNATLEKTEYELEVGGTEALNITVTPENATEKGFTYSYSNDGIVEIKDGKIVAKSAGEVTVTGTPLDTTQDCPSITFTVKVTGAAEEQDDPMPLVTNGIAHGLAYLENQSVNNYGNEWTIFTILRAGGSISAEDKAAYLESVTTAVQSGLSQPTDYARVILTLGVMGEDPTNFAGVNLIEQLYNKEGIDKMASNMISWTLLALDSKDYEIPENAVNTREKLIDWLLDFQTESGGFCLSGTSTDVDMTGMILQALAPYNNEDYPEVQAAFTKTVTWLKAQMGTTAGFAANSQYNENSCTTAQVLTALSAAGIDAVDPDNGFTFGKNNMVTNLYSYWAPSGFCWDKSVDTAGNLMGTQQTTYALEAYRRCAAGANSLYDLTDVATKDNTDYKAKLEKLVADVDMLTESEYTDDSWSAMAQKLQIARTLLQSGVTDQTQLKEASENLQSAMDALVKNTDLAAANAFIAKVDALPSADEITDDYKDTVEALLEEYEGFSKAVKNCIPEAYLTKLNDCKDKIDSFNPIKVTISVWGDSKHDSEEDGLVHTLANGNLTEWIASTEYTVSYNAKVKDVLEIALTANNMTWENATGNYVSSINGLAEFDNGNKSGWMYTLNGIHPNVGVAYQSLEDGDVIVFHYTDDYTKESEIQVNVTISNAGDIVMAQEKITVADRDYNGKYTVDEVLYAAHEVGYTGGAAAGYGSAEGSFGLYITKLWGDESGAFGYWLNDASCLSLADEVKAGDYVTAFVYTDKNTWTDAYAKFDKQTYTAAGELTVTLEKAGYDESWNTVFSKLSGATITAYDAEGKELDETAYEVKDNGDGTYTITFVQSGEYTLIASSSTTTIVPAVSKVSVSIANRDTDSEAIYKETGKLLSGYENSAYVFGAEWVALGLARSGLKVPDSYYDSVVAYVKENINANEQLHKNKSTDNSRVILALTALGYDVTDVGGHNLLKGLSSMSYIKKQGLNGPIWALIALDSHNYTIPAGDVTREKLIETILNAQLADGGWAYSGTKSDSDMTGMAIQALAPYYKTNTQVKAAVDKAVAKLSDMQLADGSFYTYNTDGSTYTNTESTAQVIVALTALGINPETDARFVKNGYSVLDALCSFAVDGGGFKHLADGDWNGMATEQGYYALVSYFRMQEGKTDLYDMSDVTIRTNTSSNVPDVVLNENAEVETPTANKVVNITSAVKNNDLSVTLSGDLAAALNLTDAEKASGVWAWIELNVLTNEEVNAKDAAAIKNGLNGSTLVTYLNIELFKQIPGGAKIAVTETGKPVTITIIVPENMRAENRTFYIAYTHNGSAAELITPISYNKETGELVFQASQFSTYALVYKTAMAGITSPDTGDESNVIFFAVPMCAGALGLAFLLAANRKRYAGKFMK